MSVVIHRGILQMVRFHQIFNPYQNNNNFVYNNQNNDFRYAETRVPQWLNLLWSGK